VSTGLALDLYLGSCVHDALAAIANGVDIDDIAQAAKTQMLEALLPKVEGEIDGIEYANEQAALVEGLIRGFYRNTWPKLMSQYPTIIAIEQEMEYQIDDSLMFMSRPDLIVEDKEGLSHFIEYKTTSSKKDDWINSWNTAVQLHSTIKAVEQTLGEAPVDVTVIGLYKSYRSYNKQNSPFCYAYHRAGNPPFTKEEFIYEYKAGYKRTPVWNMEGGVKKWIENMPEQVLGDNFPMSPPIFIKEDLVNNFFKQVQVREHEIELANQMLEGADEETKEAILNTSFEQHFDKCVPSWGHPCEYRKLCFGCVQNPLEEGFCYREAHHLKEKQQQEKENEK
jgi:hypothetical protein